VGTLCPNRTNPHPPQVTFAAVFAWMLGLNYEWAGPAPLSGATLASHGLIPGGEPWRAGKDVVYSQSSTGSMRRARRVRRRILPKGRSGGTTFLGRILRKEVGQSTPEPVS